MQNINKNGLENEGQIDDPQRCKKIPAFTTSKILAFKIVYLENVGQGRWQWCHSMPNINVCKCYMKPFFSTLALTVSEIITIQMFDFENLDHGQGLQHSQWFHSMTNVNVYKSHNWAFLASSHNFSMRLHVDKRR